MGMSVISANVTQKIVPLFISASFSGTDTLVAGNGPNSYIEVHLLDFVGTGGGNVKIIHSTLGSSYPLWSFNYGGGAAVSISEAVGAFAGTPYAANAGTATGTTSAFARKLIIPPDCRLVISPATPISVRVVGMYIFNSP